jgi:hypothetical protein
MGGKVMFGLAFQAIRIKVPDANCVAIADVKFIVEDDGAADITLIISVLEVPVESAVEDGGEQGIQLGVGLAL